jgi:ABC-2 type transport system ATP-binding protein
MLTTLLPITSGDAFINGYNVVTHPSDVRQSIGYVPQLLSADGELTGFENMLMSAKLYGIDRECRKRRIDEVLNFMDLTSVRDKLVNSYSGGMIRRLEIATALVHMPKVLFLDEPTVGLDPAAKKSVWRVIQDLNKTHGMTIFMTTHDMEEADALCNIVALMHHGKIVVMDIPKNLKADVGSKATLDDVFILHTGSSLKETEDYSHVKQTRTTISNL